ncbi:MAG: hypothetical protein K2M23_01025, partial [Alphaproteobacteria bacterium]|nr:hypothetical protein [Alphaproteobacteria bacterium]
CPAGQWQNEAGQSSCKSCSEMRIYYGYGADYTKKTTSELKWNTVYTCGNDLFGDPSKGDSKYCAEDTHMSGTKYRMNSSIGIREGNTFQLVCKPTTGEKCIYDGSGNSKKCVGKDYTW